MQAKRQDPVCTIPSIRAKIPEAQPELHPLPTSDAHPNTDLSIKFTISAATCTQLKIAALRQIELPLSK